MTAGNTKTDKRLNVTSNYGYDNIYQLTSATNSTEAYTYDPVGNRQTSTGVPSYTYNNSNQLTAKTGVTYTYDNNGNTLTKVDSTGTTTYNWDFENRLTSVVLPGAGGTVAFQYDPFGRRIQKTATVGSTNTIYVLDGADVLEEVNSTGAVVNARYTMGPGIDQPLAELRGTTTSFYHADGLGSITSLTNSSSAIANTYTYDSFGKQTASTGTVVNNFRYTTRELDPETGLMYYRARYYDSNSGRFLAEDPIGPPAGTSAYSYTKNRPTGAVDPFGLKIVVIGDTVAYYFARNYLIGDPGMAAIIHDLEYSNVIYKIHSSVGVPIDGYDTDTNEIYWNPYQAHKCAAKTKTWTQSPALALGHELAHGARDLSIPIVQYPSNSPLAPYGNSEEYRVISGPEAQAAQSLGEDTRTDHNTPTNYNVTTPTDR